MNGDHFKLLITCGATIWETVLNRSNAGTSDFRSTPAISKQSLRIFPSKFCQRKKPDQFLDLLKMPEIKETAWKSTKAKDLKWSFHILEAGLKHNPRTHARKQADRQPCYGIHEKQSFKNLTDESFSPLATTNSLSSQKDRFKAFHHKKIQSRASSKSMIAETKRPEAKISEERKLEIQRTAQNRYEREECGEEMKEENAPAAVSVWIRRWKLRCVWETKPKWLHKCGWKNVQEERTQDRGKRLRGTCCWNTRFATESRIENGIEDRRRYYFPSPATTAITKEWRVTEHKLRTREQVKLDDLIRGSSTGWGNRIKK